MEDREGRHDVVVSLCSFILALRRTFRRKRNNATKLKGKRRVKLVLEPCPSAVFVALAKGCDITIPEQYTGQKLRVADPRAMDYLLGLSWDNYPVLTDGVPDGWLALNTKLLNPPICWMWEDEDERLTIVIQFLLFNQSGHLVG